MLLLRIVMLLLLTALPVLAQSSAGYTISDQAFNAGGHPADGTVFSSASYRVSLDAIGDAALGTGLSSTSFLLDGGFAGGYAPPGEVPGLRFDDHDTLAWNGERSVGSYNLYRDLMTNLSGLGYGNCEQTGLTDETATDTAAPPVGDGYFYLVTAENRLGEEGTKGADGGGTERANPAPCP